LINDNEYWDKFYAANKLVHEPSSFAQYAEVKFLDHGKTLLELGCGNGRDSIFFAEKGKVVSALDLSLETINNLSSMNVKNAYFFHQDFSQLTNFSDIDYVYSRFTMHSVDEETERLVFEQLPKVLKKGGLFLMEARSLKDEFLEKTYGKNHFRRYLDYEKTIKKMERKGFSILEKCEGQGLAPYKKEDPFLIRVVAERL
jgi:cyclopropane fatty-acyl-phospholipid synthase-like methyltransferase